MKKLLLLLIVMTFNISYTQENWQKSSNGSLTYSFPENWSASEYLETSNNMSYGAQFFDLGKTAQFSVIEVNNETGISNAQSIRTEEIKNLVLNLFSPNSSFIIIENSTIASCNSKFVKAKTLTSNNLELSTIIHLIFKNGKMIIIQGIYTSKQESEFLPIFNKIFSNVILQ